MPFYITSYSNMDFAKQVFFLPRLVDEVER